jgi:hypothetical protein
LREGGREKKAKKDRQRETGRDRQAENEIQREKCYFKKLFSVYFKKKTFLLMKLLMVEKTYDLFTKQILFYFLTSQSLVIAL